MTIFPKETIDRNEMKWEEYLKVLTPIEFHEDKELKQKLFFKREDYFAPMGYGGINGSKLRQAIYLADSLKDPKIEYVVEAMSGTSPQHAMASAIAKHYGKQAIAIVGGKAETALKHEMLELASWFGAKFWFSKVGYNAVLQSRCLALKNHLGADKTFYLEYAITLGLHHSAEEIYNFHLVGAEQVKNIPDEVETLMIPAGSCNSSSSIFLGLALYPKKNLKKIILVTTGPSKIDYLTKRIEKMNEYSSSELRVFKGLPYEEDSLVNPLDEKTFMYEVVVEDLHGKKFATYTDKIPFTFDGIELHPNYEGKVMSYAQKYLKKELKENTLFWIVGSYPYKTVMEKVFTGVANSIAPLIDWEGV